MTIGVNNRNDAVGNGTTGTYPYGFKIFAATDLRVTVRDPDTDDETTLTYPTHYTVTGVGNRLGGNVVLAGTGNPWQDGSGFLETGWAITARRVRPLTQATDIRNQGGFFAEVHEDKFDDLTMIDQQQQDEIDRSLKLPETVSAAGVDATLPVPAASAFIGWNADADALLNYAGVTGVPATAFMATLLDDLNAAAARITLGIGGALHAGADGGCALDGVNDDTLALQAFIDANPGRKIYIGGALISAPIVVEDDNTVLFGDGSKNSNVQNTGTNTDAFVFQCATTGASDYLTNCGIIGLRVFRTNNATAGAALRTIQCNSFMAFDFTQLNHVEGIVIRGGQLSHYAHIRQSINSVITGAPVANSSLLRITTAETDGGTYQMPFTLEFNTMLFSGGADQQIQDILKIEAADGLHFTNAYWNYAANTIVRFKPNVSGKSISAVGFSNCYLDGINLTVDAISVEDDGFAGASSINQVEFDSTCVIGNVTGNGIFADHPNVVRFGVDPTTLINCAGAESDISGATGRFIGLVQEWIPTLSFTVPGDLAVTYTTRLGRFVYNKNGTVTVWFVIDTATFTHTTASGNLSILTIPASATVSGMRSLGSLVFQGITKANYTQFSPVVVSNITSMTIGCSGSGQALANVTTADMPTGGNVILRGSVTYPVSEFG